MDKISDALSNVFDVLHIFWEREKTHRFVSALIVVIFIFTLGIIELNNLGLFPETAAKRIAASQYMSIYTAFSLVLILEVIELIFALPDSMSKAVGKQFEILALIFLRSSFKELSSLPVPLNISGHHEALFHILTYGGGAIAIFTLLGIYLLMLRNFGEAPFSGCFLESFIKAKKTVALLMLALFCGMGCFNIWLLITNTPGFNFYQYFFTMLIFSDILLVLIAQYFLPQFPAVFRNSGYALATLLIRLALTAPVYYDVLLGIFSLTFALVLTFVYNKFYGREPPDHGK